MYVLLILSMCVLNVNCAIRLSDNCRNFSVEITYFASLIDEERSVILSPFGIWTFMFNILLGVSGTSETQIRRAAILLNKNEESLVKGYRELRNHVLKTDTPDISLKTKAYLFLNEGFQINPEFYRSITYDIENLNKVLDFNYVERATNTVNNYLSHSHVSSLTGLDLLKSRMVMGSSIIFEGQWELPFNKSATIIESFYDENGNITGEVVMMHQRNRFSLANVEEMGAYVLELPLGSRGKHCMLILLPSPGKTVTEVYKHLVDFPVKDVFYKLYNDTQNYGNENIEVKIPRFKINKNIVLKKTLNDMGVYDIFDQEYAEFTKVNREKLFVSTLKHHADIEVTESGVVSAAVTSAVFASETKSSTDSASAASGSTAPHTVYRINPPGYIVNRPFIYFVMEKSSVTIIFSGIYLKPSDS